MLRDLRYALRTLRRSPGFVAVAVLSLGLGLGLVTTMFGLLDAVRHPYVPFPRAESLFWIWSRWDMRNVRISRGEVLAAVRDNTHVFDAFVPVNGFTDLVREDEGSQSAFIARVPPRFFSVLGVSPELGRVLTPADEKDDVAVISHDLWKRVLRGRRGLAGTHMTIGDRSYAVVGVMPRGMTYPWHTVAWLPMSETMERSLSGATLVRLKPGATRDAANAELAVLARRLDAMYAEERNPFEIKLGPLQEQPLSLRDIHFAMLGGAIFVLLIACANLANLMLARGLNARRDLALRLAIGATRTAVIRQMFAECAIVAVAGGLIGALFSVWGSDILATRIPREMEWVGILEPELSWRVFTLSALAAAASSIAFGLLPAIRIVSSVSLDEPLKESSANTTGRVRQRYSALVVVEVALALALLMGAGLLTKVVRRVTAMDYGFPARTVVHAYAFAPLDSAQMLHPKEAWNTIERMRADVIARVSSVPGVAGVALEGSGRNPGGAISAERSTDSVPQFNTLSYPVVSAGYVHAMGFQVVEGRDFLPGDESGSGVAILNTTAAHILYPHENAVGHMVKLGSAPSGAPWVRVVGVVRSGATRMQWTNEWTDQPSIYVVRRNPALPAGLGSIRGITLVARSQRPDQQFPLLVQRAMRDVGWRLFGGVSPYLAIELSEIRTRGFLARVFATMAIFALGLAAVGLYGVLAYAVSRRMREFGVRIALGAEGHDLLKLIAHDSAVMVLAGTAIGAFLALGTSFILESYLIGVYPTDAWTLGISEAVLMLTAVAASAIPVRRAMRANPLEILRAI